MRRSNPLREFKRFFSIMYSSIAQGFGTVKFIALTAAALLAVSALVAGVALAIDSIADEGAADALSQTGPVQSASGI